MPAYCHTNSLVYQNLTHTFDKRGRCHVRGSWEFAPLSSLYLVFNESSFRDSYSFFK